MSEWISIFKDKDQYKVELIKNELINNDIEAVVLNKVDHNYPILGFSELRVMMDDKVRAEVLVNQYLLND
jgi:hypothetical protein